MTDSPEPQSVDVAAMAADPGEEPVLRRPSRRGRWLRALAITGSAVALALVVRRIDLADLAAALASVRPAYYAVALCLFGLGLLPSGLRWHTLLRLNQCAISKGVSVRMTFMSHFFATLLVGPSSGDLPKTVYYSKWYGFRGSDVLAASMLDRLVSGVAGLIFIALALALAQWSGGFEFLGRIQWQAPPPAWGWALGGALAAALAVAVHQRHRPDSLIGRTVRAFGRIAFRLAGCGRSMGRAVGFSLLVVSLLTLAQVCCVQAAVQTSIPWVHLFWCLHLATMIASLPITVAGLGLREGAYLALLGIYGVPAPQAVAAALLVLSLHAFWAMVGFALWIREQRASHRRPNRN